MMKLTTFVLGSISLIIQQYADYFKEEDLSVTLTELEGDLSLPRIQTYDYVVVGGGSAGCIVAGRLSEKFRVLLLEKGGNPVPATNTPYLAHDDIKFDPSINDIFHSEKQTHFTLRTEGIFKITSGRMLGGSGGHNDNNYNRGSPFDYDNIANLVRDDSWSYKNVLKHFKRMENYAGRLIQESERAFYYGSGGPINVITADHPPRLLPYWLEAGKKLGFKVADPNGHQSVSFTPIALSMQGGQRDNSYISYIKPYEGKRKTLTVLRYSEVEQILLDERNTANGVTFKRHGIPQIAHASKEVILSAGAISSPLLLIKSGIGPKTVLDDAKIPLKVDLPGLGKNLRDHCGVFLHFNINNGSSSSVLPDLSDRNVEAGLVKFQSPSPSGRSGIFSIPFSMAQAFVSSSRAKAEGEGVWPDLQLLLFQSPYNEDVYRSVQGKDFQIGISLNRQKSVGELRFNTSAYLMGQRDDTQLALIDNKFLTDESDVDSLMEGIKLSLKVVEETEMFRNLKVEYKEPVPASCKSLKFRSDSYWKCYIMQTSETWFHSMSTGQMGVDEDPDAVVDSKLRVRGVKRLRIVDASVFPRTPNANINSPVMMAAEKVAYEIMWSQPISPPIPPVSNWPGIFFPPIFPPPFPPPFPVVG